MAKAKKKAPAKMESTKKTLTKNEKILVIALVSVLVIAITCVTIVCVHNHNEKKKLEAIRSNYARYDACSEDLNSLVYYLCLLYPDVEKRPDYLMVASDDLYLAGGEKVMMSKELNKSVDTIAKKGFVSGKAQWRLISFNGNRIQFDVSDGNYALVYSPDGEPTYLHSETDDFEILVEHIEGHWYHVARMN